MISFRSQEEKASLTHDSQKVSWLLRNGEKQFSAQSRNAEQIYTVYRAKPNGTERQETKTERSNFPTFPGFSREIFQDFVKVSEQIKSWKNYSEFFEFHGDKNKYGIPKLRQKIN